MIKEILAVLLILVAGYVVFVSSVSAQLYVCQNNLTMYSGGWLFYGMDYQQMIHWCSFGKLLYYGSWAMLIISIVLLLSQNDSLNIVLGVIGAIYLLIFFGGLVGMSLPQNQTQTNLNIQGCLPQNFSVPGNNLIYQSDITYPGETGKRTYYSNNSTGRVFGKIDETRCFLQFYNVSVPSLPKGQQLYQVLDCIFDATKGIAIECNAINSLEVTATKFS
jgi:hypothetical protein